MQINRLVFFECLTTGRRIGHDERIVSFAEAAKGLPVADQAKLQNGQDVKFELIAAGIKAHGRLVPMFAPNRQGMERRKREAQQV